MKPEALRALYDAAADEWAAFKMAVFTPGMGWVTGSVVNLESITETASLHMVTRSGECEDSPMFDVRAIQVARIVGLA